MSELLEQREDYVREIRLSEAICNLPVEYHPIQLPPPQVKSE